MRAKKTTSRTPKGKTRKPQRAIRARQAASAKRARVSWRSWTPLSIGVGLILVVATAALIAARQPSAPAHDEEPASLSGLANTVDSAEAVSPEAVPQPDTSPSSDSSAKREAAPAPSAAPVKAASAETDAEPDAEPTPAARPAVQDAPPVAISGCLDADQDTFWLRDTSGDAAPTARSWRSGFLKKRPAPIALVDTHRSLKLQNYVGQRVVATGTLTNREMRAESLQRVATSCS